MRFTTESGSTYEINGSMVRRVNPGYEKRADGEWKELLNEPEIVLGGHVLLVMESLADYGPDDYVSGGGGPTVRRTSRVTEVWV